MLLKSLDYTSSQLKKSYNNGVQGSMLHLLTLVIKLHHSLTREPHINDAQINTEPQLNPKDDGTKLSLMKMCVP